MKNKQTGITAHVPRAPLRTSPPHSTKNSLWFYLALAGIVGAIGAGTYFLWPMPNDDPFGIKAEQRTPKLNPDTPPGPAPAGMVWVRGGEFWMGDEIPTHHENVIAQDCLPPHKVYVDGFWMDQHEVTNEKWALFVKETGYVTLAEKKPDPRDFPDVPKDAEDLKHPFSLVFKAPGVPIHDLDRAHQENWWWTLERGADWKHPEGKKSSIDGKAKYPVVHVAFADAEQYCRWLSKKSGKTYRLPTEAEWEFAARGGLDRKKFTWGDEITPDGKWMANIWQGKFPNENTAADGFAGLAPVGSYPPNGYGLYDMAGNAWEWCQDYYKEDYYALSPSKNPTGPVVGVDPNEPGMPKRVQRGGSFLCADNYCIRYLVAARGKGEEKSAANHTGFRCICEAK